MPRITTDSESNEEDDLPTRRRKMRKKMRNVDNQGLRAYIPCPRCGVATKSCRHMVAIPLPGTYKGWERWAHVRLFYYNRLEDTTAEARMVFWKENMQLRSIGPNRDPHWYELKGSKFKHWTRPDIWPHLNPNGACTSKCLCGSCVASRQRYGRSKCRGREI